MSHIVRKWVYLSIVFFLKTDQRKLTVSPEYPRPPWREAEENKVRPLQMTEVTKQMLKFVFTLIPRWPGHPWNPCVPFTPGSPLSPCHQVETVEYLRDDTFIDFLCHCSSWSKKWILQWYRSELFVRGITLTDVPSSPGCPWLPCNPGLPWKTEYTHIFIYVYIYIYI